MAKEITSPFSPGFPVPVELFVGRAEEIEYLRGKIRAARSGKLQVAFLTGERGIGKTSLAAYMHAYAQNVENMLGVHVMVGGVDTVEGAVGKVFDRLLKDSIDRPWYGKVVEFFGRQVKQIGLFGVTVELALAPEDLRSATQDFARILRKLVSQFADDKQGLLLILDDINGIAASEPFANWLKSLVDEIAISGHGIPLCLLLVGLEERRHQLITLQPSLARVFDVVHIRGLSPQEMRNFYTNAFACVGISVSDDALEVLVSNAGGLPVLAHELGEVAFSADADNLIDFDDACWAAAATAAVVGRKYLEPQIISEIRSAHHRSILKKMALEEAQTFSRKQVLDLLTDDEKKVFDNFIVKMRQLGVITNTENRGEYRFSNELHRLYFSM